MSASSQQPAAAVPPRHGTVTPWIVHDPLGNGWWLHVHAVDVDADALQHRLADPAMGTAMAYVQGSLTGALQHL